MLRGTSPASVADGSSAQRGSLRCYVTDDPQRFQRLAPRFLGVEIDAPVWVSPDELYNQRPNGPVPLSVPA